ncbi:hypothetical protein EXIGLDRAFT_845547 [Exidia glandulosa HHB12029]|uniref:Uncharacterized protein n=1 Tax=Exidia glandulosa HHB12029 TaxID=1314781 RepID=A0A165BDY1_EXIGL|nr:hypothetical protein EXIGLDRAFT_845547 [Exidia glandulosa HHB12029]
MSLNSTPNAEPSEPGGVLELDGRHVLALRSTGPEHEKLDSPAQPLEPSIVSTSPAKESGKAPVYGCPIQRLPVELLAMVFRNAILPDSDGFLAMRRAGKPYEVASTCRHWRGVALHSPELWSVVDYLINDLWTIQLEERVAASLRLHLDRSSQLPLDTRTDVQTVHQRRRTPCTRTPVLTTGSPPRAS